MLIKNLITEAAKKSGKSVKKDYTKFAPNFDASARDSYDSVSKYLRVLGHAEHLDSVDVKVSISSVGAKFDIHVRPHLEDTTEEALAAVKSFWAKALGYFSKLKNDEVTVSVFKKDPQLSLKDMLTKINKATTYRGPYSIETFMVVSIVRKTKTKSDVDYDALLKQVRQEKDEHFKSVGKSPNLSAALKKRVAANKEKTK